MCADNPERFGLLSHWERGTNGALVIHLDAPSRYVTMSGKDGAVGDVASVRERRVPGLLYSASAAIRLVDDEQQRWVVIERDAAARFDPLKWQWPAGRCAPGELPVDTAVREAAEEVAVYNGTDAQAPRLVPRAPSRAPRGGRVEAVFAQGPIRIFEAHWYYSEQTNTLEFVHFFDLPVDNCDHVRTVDLEPYHRRVLPLTREDLSALVADDRACLALACSWATVKQALRAAVAVASPTP